MSDARLRELERLWRMTGSAEDEAALLAERLRLGLVEPALDVAHLSAIARAIEAASAQDVSVEVDVDAPGFMFPREAREALEADLAHLTPLALARAYPREDDGRLPLGETVLLASYACDDSLSRGRAAWLAACSPAKRREPQVIAVRLVSELADNRPHRWDQARHLWDDRNSPPSDDTDLATVALLESGRYEDALARHGIVMSQGVRAVLAGSERHQSTAWAAALRRALSECAPWHMARAATSARLFALPGQTQQSKTSLVLAPGALELKSTASNQRLAETLWKRPLDGELRRRGLLRAPDDAAPAPARHAPPASDRVAEVFELLGRGATTKAHALAKRLGPSALAGRATRALGEPGLRSATVALVAAVRIPVTISGLAACLEDPDASVRSKATQALGQEIGPAGARLAAVQRALGDPSPDVRYAAVDAAARLRCADDVILGALRDSSEKVRIAACRIVASRKLEAAIPRLLELARGRGYGGRTAVETLGALRAHEAWPLVLKALREALADDVQLRVTETATALRRIGAVEALPALRELLAHGVRPHLRRTLEQAIAGLERGNPGSKRPRKQ